MSGMIRIKVEFLYSHNSDVYSVSRVPIRGEHVYLNLDDEPSEVKEVFHKLDADPTYQIVAIVRVTGCKPAAQPAGEKP